MHSTIGLLFAGYESTGSFFQSIVFFMEKFKDSFTARLVKEVSHIELTPDLSVWKEIQSCKYLEAFFRETLQRNPPFTFDIPRPVRKKNLIYQDPLNPSVKYKIPQDWQLLFDFSCFSRHSRDNHGTLSHVVIF